MERRAKPRKDKGQGVRECFEHDGLGLSVHKTKLCGENTMAMNCRKSRLLVLILLEAAASESCPFHSMLRLATATSGRIDALQQRLIPTTPPLPNTQPTHTGGSHAVPAAPPSPPPPPPFASHGLLRPRSRCSHSQQPTLPLLPLLPPRHEAAAQHHPSSHDLPLHPAHPPSFQTARLPSGLASGLATTPPLLLAWVGGWVVGTTMGRR